MELLKSLISADLGHLLAVIAAYLASMSLVMVGLKQLQDLIPGKTDNIVVGWLDKGLGWAQGLVDLLMGNPKH